MSDKPPVDLRRRHLCLAALAAAGASRHALAQEFPARSLRILVGFSAGSPSDALARALAEKMSRSFGHPVIVENKPGAGGIVAIKALLQSPADGYTMLVVSAAHAATPAIRRNLDFDPIKDLSGITRIANVPSILVANPNLGAKTLKDLLEKIRQAPGALSYSTPSRGSANHFAAAYLLAKTGLRAADIPYKGVPEALTAVISGECQFSFVPVPNAVNLVREGRVLALAASTGARSNVLPDVPTVAEAGVPGYAFDPWFGLLTQSAVPAATRAKLVAASQEALAAADIRTRFEAIGADISPLPGERFDSYIRDEIAKFKAIAADAGIEST
ncbi:MAG: tripartite tricarboxylate transporter substrate-binding protein [Hyphomicrobiales bacterium]